MPTQSVGTLKVLRSHKEVFSKDKYPTLSFAFLTDEFVYDEKFSIHLIDADNGKVRACCYEYEHGGYMTFVVIIHRDFFKMRNGWSDKATLREALIVKAGIKKIIFKENKLWFGFLWTNELPKYPALYEKSISSIKIWEAKSQAKLDYNRTAKLINWSIRMSTHLQRNIPWREVKPFFSEYVNSVDYPSDTLVSNFQLVVQKLGKPISSIRTM